MANADRFSRGYSVQPGRGGVFSPDELVCQGRKFRKLAFLSLRGEILRLAAVLLLDGEEWKPMGKRTCRKSAAHF